MIKGEILLVVCSARVLSNGCKSQVIPNSGNYIAKGKGAHRELESERNRRQMPFMISIYLLPDCFQYGLLNRGNNFCNK